MPAVLLLLLPRGLAVAAAEEAPRHVYRAQPDVEIRIFDTGALTFFDTGRGVDLVRSPETSKSSWVQRTRRSTAPFTALAPEGVVGGRRGAPQRADDDGDGVADEDRLDGRDNDGDGRIDEDFAAISDAMFVVDADAGDRRLEFYHWAYPHLSSALFVHLSGAGDPSDRADYTLELPLGEWLQTPVVQRRHSLVGRPVVEEHTAFVAKLTYAGVREKGRWVGVMDLGDPADPKAIVAQRARLELRHGGDRSFVVCAADSWLQLNRLLGDAARVARGMTDPVSGKTTRWVVPPSCPICRQAAAPEFTWSVTAQNELLLRMRVEKDASGLPDPDLFALGGMELGSPREMIWRPAVGAARSVRWTAMTPALLVDPVPQLSDPYGSMEGLCSHGAAGELTLRYTLPDEAGVALAPAAQDPGETFALELQGRWLDGRALSRTASGSFEAPAAPATAAIAPAGGVEALRDPDSNSGRLALATNLLSGFPNPFRDAIQVRFHIPQTVGEAFEPDEDDGWPAELDLRAAVPWRTGVPFVTVKIYRINGQELVTLLQEYVSSGELTVQWDGTDGYGRSVASGPYFCKLQMDEWSVTRQIIYIR